MTTRRETNAATDETTTRLPATVDRATRDPETLLDRFDKYLATDFDPSYWIGFGALLAMLIACGGVQCRMEIRSAPSDSVNAANDHQVDPNPDPATGDGASQPAGTMANPAAVLHRRQLSEPQRAMVAARLLPHFKEEAKERQRSSGGNKAEKAVVANLPQPLGKARDKAGEAVRVSGRSVSQRAMVAARARDYYTKEADKRRKEGQKHGGQTRQGSTPVNLPASSDARDAAGKAVNVSGKSVDARALPDLVASQYSATLQVNAGLCENRNPEGLLTPETNFANMAGVEHMTPEKRRFQLAYIGLVPKDSVMDQSSVATLGRVSPCSRDDQHRLRSRQGGSGTFGPLFSAHTRALRLSCVAGVN